MEFNSRLEDLVKKKYINGRGIKHISQFLIDEKVTEKEVKEYMFHAHAKFEKERLGRGRKDLFIALIIILIVVLFFLIPLLCALLKLPRPYGGFAIGSNLGIILMFVWIPFFKSFYRVNKDHENFNRIAIDPESDNL